MLSEILSDDNDIEFLAAIRHEITHAEQNWEREKNWEYVKSQNYDFSKLSSYQKKLFLPNSGAFKAYVNYLYKQVSQGTEETKCLSDEDKALWLKLEAEDNYEWFNLKKLIYACCPIELAAENNAQKFIKKISKICPEIYIQESDLEFYLGELQDDGYKFSHKDIENFVQMSCITDMLSEDFIDGEDILFAEIEYLLNIYKTKKVKYPFMDYFDEDYEDLENEYFKYLQEVCQEEDLQENQLEE